MRFVSKQGQPQPHVLSKARAPSPQLKPTTVKWPCVLDCKPRWGGGGWGYYWEFLVEMCRPVLQILTRFQTKKLLFSTSVFKLDL